MRTRAICGCSGRTLTAAEGAFFEETKPWGFILFGRNVGDKDQLKSLTKALRETVADPSAPILIDQEGGRVARLKPPQWSERPPASAFGAMYLRDQESAREAVYLNARLIADDLEKAGINVNCAPLLDVPVEGADPVIGDRAFGTGPAVVIDLARAFIEGLLEGGVLPIMKHVPGHGRAFIDSHRDLPRIATEAAELSATDFVTFRSLNHCPMAMTAHVVYEAIDSQRPATTSPKVIRDVIRGEIGFEGILISDDISMGALSGPISTRTKAALFAGCDIVLHCNGSMAEMEEVAEEARALEGAILRRADHVVSQVNRAAPLERGAAEARLHELLGGHRD